MSLLGRWLITILMINLLSYFLIYILNMVTEKYDGKPAIDYGELLHYWWLMIPFGGCFVVYGILIVCFGKEEK